jgi:hypothetical protein
MTKEEKMLKRIVHIMVEYDYTPVSHIAIVFKNKANLQWGVLTSYTGSDAMEETKRLLEHCASSLVSKN